MFAAPNWPTERLRVRLPTRRAPNRLRPDTGNPLARLQIRGPWEDTEISNNLFLLCLQRFDVFDQIRRSLLHLPLMPLANA